MSRATSLGVALFIVSGCADVKHFQRISVDCDPRADRCVEQFACFDRAGHEVNYRECAALPYRVYVSSNTGQQLGNFGTVNNPAKWHCYGTHDQGLTLEQCGLCFDPDPTPRAVQGRKVRATRACAQIAEPPDALQSLFPFPTPSN